MEQKAIMKVLGDMSDEAGKAMSGKLIIKASSKEEAEQLLDKAEDAVEKLPEGGEEEKSMMDMAEEAGEEEEFDESEEDYFEKGMDDYEAEPEMPSEKFEEDDMRDFSGMSEEELDDEIEKLMKMRERMKVASLKY